MAHAVLTRLHQAAGAHFQEAASGNSSRVEHYGHIRREIKALRTGVGLIDCSHDARIEAHGKDRVRFLNSMLSNEVATLQPGQGSYALLLTPQGKVVADLQVYSYEDLLLLTLSAEVHGPGMGLLDKYLIADKVTWKDISDQTALLSLQGPLLQTVLERVLPGVQLPSGPYGHALHMLNEGAVRLLGHDRLGLGGIDLVVPLAHLEPLWHALLAAGATPVGQHACEVVRVEQGRPRVGLDVSANNIPQEAGNAFEARAISYKKGCYIGQEVVCRVKSRGHVNWMLTQFKLPPQATVAQRLFLDGKDVGWVTSVVESPDHGPVGLGYVHRNARKIGEKLFLGSAEGPAQVELQELPSTPV